MKPDDLPPHARVERSLKALNQIAGAFGVGGAIATGFAVVLEYIDRLPVKKVVPVTIWPSVVIGMLLIGMAVLLMVCRHGITANERWAPRLARRIGLALSTCPLIWLALMISPLPLGPILWQVFVLAAMCLLGTTSYVLAGDLKAVTALIDSLQPVERAGFAPIMPATPLEPNAPDHLTDNSRAK